MTDHKLPAWAPILGAAVVAAIGTWFVNTLLDDARTDSETASATQIADICEQIVSEKLSDALSTDSGRTLGQEMVTVKEGLNELEKGQIEIKTNLTHIVAAIRESQE